MSVLSASSASTVRGVQNANAANNPGDDNATPSRRHSSVSSASPRRTSIQRLGSPAVGAARAAPSPATQPIPEQTPMSAFEADPASVGPGRSALAAALASYDIQEPVRHGTPPIRTSSPGPAPSERMSLLDSHAINSNYGTPSVRNSSPRPLIEDPEVVRRHLVQPEDVGRSDPDSTQARGRFRRRSRLDSPAPSVQARHGLGIGGSDEFSSLQLQGGDITRQIYRWAEGTDVRSIRAQRSRSFTASRPEPLSETLDISQVKAPGGLRRNYLARTGRRASPSASEMTGAVSDEEAFTAQPQRTSNFLEFLTLYGHFAGEELEEGADEEDDAIEEEAVDDQGERRPLLRRTLTGPERRRKRTMTGPHGKASATNATATLLKSFVGTGVLFLPRAFMNGGMLFSSLVLVGLASVSYYCFLLLVSTQRTVGGSFGDMGEHLYGRFLRIMILGSLVLSQVGFVSAYIVFTSENLRAFIEAVSRCRTFIDIKWMVLMQLIILLPFSLIRDISRLAFTAYIADAFICLGLIYLYSADIGSLTHVGLADITSFNPNSWTLFIGTAIFTFEGIGLILPIKESMKEPKKFPYVLAGVMVFITILFTSIGALSYAAFGSKTNTVILLNFDQESKFVNAVQFLYSLAILLSTPLQLFPAIRILEQALFKRSGRQDLKVKWLKNFFRFGICVFCALLAWLGASDLDKFVSLVGSFACIPLVYVYPPMLHYKGTSAKSWEKVVDVILVFVGAVFMVYTTALTIKSWSAGSPASPGYCDK